MKSVWQVQIESAKKKQKPTSFYDTTGHCLLNSYENPAQRRPRYFNIAAAWWLHQELHANIQINKICTCPWWHPRVVPEESCRILHPLQRILDLTWESETSTEDIALIMLLCLCFKYTLTQKRSQGLCINCTLQLLSIVEHVIKFINNLEWIRHFDKTSKIIVII